MKIQHYQAIHYTSNPGSSKIADNNEAETKNIDSKKSYASKVMLGSSIVAGIIALGIAGKRGLLGNKIKIMLGRRTPNPRIKPTEIIEPPKMEMNENAAKIYNDIQNSCSGHIEIKINDNQSKTLKNIAEFYKEAEEVSNLPNKLEELKIKLKDKSIDELFELETQNRHSIYNFEEIIKEKKHSFIYEQGNENTYLEEFDQARFKHNKAIDKLIQNTTQEKLENLSIKELYDLYFQKIKEISIFKENIKKAIKNGAKEKKGFFNGYNSEINYEYNANLLGKYGKSDYIHLQETKKLIDKIIDKKREGIYQKLIRPNDKEISVSKLYTYANTEAQKAFCEYYDLYPYNSALRSGEKLDEDARHTIKIMDNVFFNAPELTQDSIVYRAVHGHPIFKEQQEFIKSLKEGIIIKDPSYVSTSTNTTNAQFKQFANSVIDDFGGALMRIKLPKGTKGVLGGYDEFILPRGTQLKINKVEEVDGIKILDCEYIQPDRIQV